MPSFLLESEGRDDAAELTRERAPAPGPTTAPEPAPAPGPATAPEPAPQEAAVRAAGLTPTEAFATVMGASPRRRVRRWPIVLVIVVAIVVAYVFAALALQDRVPDGTTVAGASMGTTATDARAALLRLKAAAADTPITLVAGGASTSISPADASLAIDVDATLASVTGLTFSPFRLWAREYGSGGEVRAAVSVDHGMLAKSMATVAARLDSTPSNATVTMVGAEAIVAPSTPSIVVDQASAGIELVRAWPSAEPIAISAIVTDADVSTSQAQALADTLNTRVFAGATTLASPNGDVTLTGAQVAAVSSAVPVDGRLTWQVDGHTLAAEIVASDPGINNEPVNAAYAFDARHQLSVVIGVPGRTIDPNALGAAVVAAAGTTSRTVDMPYIETPPDVTADELPTEDFTTRVSSFKTPLTNEPIRTRNLVRGAELVTGTIVKPHENFNLASVLEPYTKENGYYPAHVIENGLVTYGMGGGLSQMATTTFNAGYFAGMEDVTHRPHSVWFPRYPAGRESTIFQGQINMVFKNTTPYALLMNSYVAKGYLYVDIWSTPYYRVTTEASPKTKIVQPTMRTIHADSCLAYPNGQPGFTITNTRKLYIEDALVETKSYTWTYLPDDGVKCA